ncbi:DUF2975 domain-containing protein [Aurantiacibacter sp. D1-12]|uniref:DUF2975 domain-containing protein n=1 Tax=Aurantiacibacter sp. D1-12 TaxID=2993658 RepID=UPI00237D2E8B|nr:DUF2975 domain-containing protein [Aurantiacibacter sp. D1-12]MDE1468485.1 DUF2975 domain-containing protein [Aurantiacibacter sp. D1-12]
MSTLTNDPLLIAAKAIIYFMLGVIAFAGIIVAIAIPGVFIFGAEFAGELASGELTMGNKVLVSAFLAAVAGLLFLAWRFLWAMLNIAKSVGEGDPFAPANGDRLTTMAWIALAINVLALPVAGLGVFIAQTIGEETGSVDASLDFGGILLVLVLFILARVFRHGTAMRDDLEGTV